MHTFEIIENKLDEYKNNKLSDERIDALVAQANEQLDEIAQDEAFYNDLLAQVDAPKTIDNLILWILFMSNEDIVDAYIRKFKKDFMDIIPVSDLADLLLYVVHLTKVQNVKVEGFDHLLAYSHEGIEEIDQYCFLNVLTYVQKSKETEIEF